MQAVGDNLILAINGGSSSIKFSVYRQAPLECALHGSIDGLGEQQAQLTATGNAVGGGTLPVVAGNLSAAPQFLASWLSGRIPATGLLAVAHRVVYPHPAESGPSGVDANLLARLRQASASEYEHLPMQLALIEALQAGFPGAHHIACFDSSFHADLPAVAARLPIPRRYHALGIRRYGFHGISCAYIVRALATLAGPEAARGRLVIAHLGSGASVTAVLAGQSRDTTMGLTPVGGIMMARRSGDLDPGLARELARRGLLDAEGFHEMVHHASGLLGVSGISGDMRELLGRESTDQHAAEAVNLFCYQVRKAICAMAGAIDGIDTLVFTGGIGEHAAPVRERICTGLAHLGVQLDAARNAAAAAVISTPASRTTVRVIATDEQSMLAQYALAHLAAVAGPL